jgi:hypothetical protein
MATSGVGRRAWRQLDIRPTKRLEIVKTVIATSALLSPIEKSAGANRPVRAMNQVSQHLNL